MNPLQTVLYRLSQFKQAITTKLTASDLEFIRQYLTQKEQVIFYRMRLFDQRHVLLLAQTFLDRQHLHDYTWVDKNLFIRASLLHDVGKSFIPISVWMRGLYVVLQHWRSGELLKRRATAQATKPFWQKMTVLANHGEFGAKMLENLGVLPEIIDIARFHHSKPKANDNPLLAILREIDSKI